MSEVIKTTRFLELCKVIGLNEGDKINVDGYHCNPYTVMDKGIFRNGGGWMEKESEYRLLKGIVGFTIIPELPEIKDPYTEFCTVDEMQAACKELGIELVNDMKVVVTDCEDGRYSKYRYYKECKSKQFYCYVDGKTPHTSGDCFNHAYMKLVK